MTSYIMHDPINIQIARDDAPDTMKALWRVQNDSMSTYEMQLAALQTLGSILKGYLISGGDAMAIAGIFSLTGETPQRLRSDAATTMQYWQGYARVAKDSEDRCDTAKQAIQATADVYTMLHNGIFEQLRKRT